MADNRDTLVVRFVGPAGVGKSSVTNELYSGNRKKGPAKVSSGFGSCTSDAKTTAPFCISGSKVKIRAQDFPGLGADINAKKILQQVKNTKAGALLFVVDAQSRVSITNCLTEILLGMLDKGMKSNRVGVCFTKCNKFESDDGFTEAAWQKQFGISVNKMTKQNQRAFNLKDFSYFFSYGNGGVCSKFAKWISQIEKRGGKLNCSTMASVGMKDVLNLQKQVCNCFEPEFVKAAEEVIAKETCYDADSTFVTLVGGKKVQMKDVRNGDVILTPVGSEVVYVHYLAETKHKMIKFSLDDGSQLTCTPDHMCIVNGKGKLITAESVQIGDTFENSRGDTFRVEKTEIVFKAPTNVRTSSGCMYVNGLVGSCRADKDDFGYKLSTFCGYIFGSNVSQTVYETGKHIEKVSPTFYYAARKILNTIY